MWKTAIWLLAVAGTISLPAQESSDEFGAAVKRSLDRARALYPESVEPGCCLKPRYSRPDRLAASLQPCDLFGPQLASASDCHGSGRAGHPSAETSSSQAGVGNRPALSRGGDAQLRHDRSFLSQRSTNYARIG